MSKDNLLGRISIDPKIMAGQPVIKGTRLTVPFILGLMAQGMTVEDILKEYYRLSKEDIFACFAFAQNALVDITFIPLAN